MSYNLPIPPEDALHGVMARYAADNRPKKIDLGVGVYRDETGASPIMEAVLNAEKTHIEKQVSKSYLSLRGHDVYLQAMQNLTFDDKHKDVLASIQCVGGTGGIRLALNMAKLANSELRVLIGMPTWPNHVTICEQLGIEVLPYSYFDKQTQAITFEAMIEAISSAKAGDILILHGPCHNPSGADLTDRQMKNVIEACNTYGIILLIDAAYYGLGEGLDADLDKIRHIVDSVPTAMLIMSCSKAFGLYRERTGILFVKTENSDQLNLVQKTLERLARGTYSMPPAHGAAVVGRILSDPYLSQKWKAELISMRERLLGVRKALVRQSKGDSRLDAITAQKGIFSLLPISSSDVEIFAKNHAIYMPSSGRINIAGFKINDVELFCDAFSKL